MNESTWRLRGVYLCSTVFLVATYGCSGREPSTSGAVGSVGIAGQTSGTAGQGGNPGGAAPSAGQTATGRSGSGASAGNGTSQPSGAGGSDTGAAGTKPSGAAAGTDAGLAAGSGVAQPANAWLRMGYDHKNQYWNPMETTISTANASTLVEKWRFTVSGFPPGSPVVADGKVFKLATGGLYAIDLETGKELWKRMDIAGTSSAAYEDGFVYIHANGTTKLVGQLHKLNAADGTTVWGPIVTYDLENCDGTSSPMLADGKVLVGHGCGVRELALDGTNKGPRGGIEAFSTETGKPVWTYWSVPETGEDGAMSWSTVSIDMEEKTVFAGTGNNYTVGGPNSDAIHKFDLASGMRMWVTQVREDDVWQLTTGNVKDTDFGANPILAEVDGKKIVAAGDKGAAFWAMDRATGQILWSREMLTPSRSPANGGILNNGAFDGKHFYVASNDPSSMSSVLYKLDPLTGADVWKKTYPKLVWGGMSLANGVLLAPINDELHVLDAATGDTLTMFNTGGTIAGGAAAIVQGKVIVQSGLAYALSNTLNNNQIICYGLP
jgi:outer membrane protein assembly factor BamB